MSASTDKKQALKGAEWLIKESSAFETFIPEDFNEEQQMVKDMCNAFLDAEVLPVIDRIDKLEQGLMPSLIQKAGEQGLLGVAVPEEHKMGIKGSSTVQLYFQDCKVPAENLLGEIGKGHIIAFNILNIGRLKLCAAALGAAKRAATITLEYAKTREQFKTPIANFGAIKNKLAEMAIRI